MFTSGPSSCEANSEHCCRLPTSKDSSGEGRAPLPTPPPSEGLRGRNRGLVAFCLPRVPGTATAERTLRKLNSLLFLASQD